MASALQALQQAQRIIAWRQLFFIFDYDTKVCYVFPAITATATAAAAAASRSGMQSQFPDGELCRDVSDLQLFVVDAA